MPRSASYISLLKLIWFGGSGNMKLYGRDYIWLWLWNAEPKWIQLHPGKIPWKLMTPLTPTDSFQICNVFSHSGTRTKMLHNCLWKIPHRFLMVHLKISKIKSVAVFSKITWEEKKSLTYYIILSYIYLK